MELLCDANVILDVFLKREPFYADSAQVLNMCEDGYFDGYIPVSTVADIYYIIRRATSNKDKAFAAIEAVTKVLKPCSVMSDDLTVAMAAHGTDFEDNLIEACAVRNSFDYIVTRNKRHFGDLGMPVVSPEELLDKYRL